MYSAHAVRQVIENYPFAAPFLEKYRLGVHQFASAPTNVALENIGHHLETNIPKSLHRFYSQWNGAILFRGELIIRSASELAPVSQELLHLIVFADEPNKERIWAFAPEGAGFVFGVWTGEQFIPCHGQFEEWLYATLSVFDGQLENLSDDLDFRGQLLPNNPYLQTRKIDAFLQQGQLKEACALAADIGEQTNWGHMLLLHGSLLYSLGLPGPELAYAKGLSRLTLPCAHPSQLPSTEMLYPLQSILTQEHGASILEVLEKCCFEQIHNLQTPKEVEIAEALIQILAQHYAQMGQRQKACDKIQTYLSVSEGFACQSECPSLMLTRAWILFDMGMHDEVEKNVRSFRYSTSQYRSEADLLVGATAVLRQEPWGNEILHGLIDMTEDLEQKLQAWYWIGVSQFKSQNYNEAIDIFLFCLEHADLREMPNLFNRVIIALSESYLIQENSELVNETLSLIDPRIDPAVQIELNMVIASLEQSSEVALGILQESLVLCREQEFRFLEAQLLLALASRNMNGVSKQAHVLCKKIGFPLGVLQAESTLVETPTTVEWHIDSVQGYMRTRIRAQRSQRPLRRCDSELPERRIQMHRIAVAKGQKSVVDALAREMLIIEKELQDKEVLISNTRLHRYMAAADLLCFHPSLHAAESLLRMLIDERATGAVRQALIHAVSRSRNMALVEGLIKVLRNDEPGRHLLAVIEILGWRREAAAVSSLRQRLDPKYSLKSRKTVLRALGRIGNQSVTDDLCDLLDEPDLLEECALSLLLLGEWQGLDALAQYLHLHPEKAPYTFGELVGRHGGRNYLLLLSQVAAQHTEASIGAILGLGYIGDIRAVPILLEQCTHSDTRHMFMASQALEIITGHFENPNEILLRTRWEDWWESNKSQFKAGQTYRYGKVYSIRSLLEDLQHDNALVRQNSYDELVISTGCTLPFDVEGPWMVQLQQIADWLKWSLSQDFPVGRKYFFGEDLL